MFKELDPVLHSQLRLAIMSLLIGVKEAEFSYLKEKTGATAGNLSVQISKLVDSSYVNVRKTFRDNYPLTTCRVTRRGMSAYAEYVASLKEYLKPKPKSSGGRKSFTW